MEEPLRLLWRAFLQSISLLPYPFLSPISDCVYAYACLLGSVGASLPVSACLCLYAHLYSCFGGMGNKKEWDSFAGPSFWFCVSSPALISDPNLYPTPLLVNLPFRIFLRR